MTFSGSYPTTFSGNTAAMVISHTTVSGGITNVGTIGPGGIAVISSTLQSGIVDTGTILGGISVDGNSTIVGSSGAAVAVIDTATFGGGISNAGVASATTTGVQVSAVTAFTGGVSNSGSISGNAIGIDVAATSSFGGGIVNGAGGEIAAGQFGVFVSGVTAFAGDVVNRSGGTISASRTGIVIAELVGSNPNFSGVTFSSGATLELGSGASFKASGGEINAGIAVKVLSAGTPTLSGAAISAGTLVETLSSGTIFVSGAFANSGTLTESGAGSLLEINGNAVVTGGAVVIGNGVVDVLSGGSANIAFLAAGSGGLEIADTHLNSSTFTGTVSGFGGMNHTNHKQFIDLVSVASAPSTISLSYVSSASHTSGTLFVSSGGAVVAQINMIGNYTSKNFSITADSNGNVEIVAPAVPNGGSVTPTTTQTFPEHAVDLHDIAFGAHTTLAYAQNGAGTGGTLTVSDGRHAAAISLLGNYIAGSFVIGADGHGGTLLTAVEQTQQAQLTPPHG